MKKPIPALIIIMMALTMMSFSKKPLYKSKPLEPASQRPEPGTAAWIDRLQYNDKDKIAYGCFNDDSNLVIRLKVTDKNVVTKIFVAGFTISIDTTAKKDPQFSIKYPLPQGIQSMPQAADRNPGGLNPNLVKNPNEKMKNRMKTALNQIEINGFGDETVKNTLINSRSGPGITAWIMIDTAMNMYYELKIPLQDIAGLDFFRTKLISIGFESGSMAMPSGGPQGGGSPGGGMRPPGERPQGGGPDGGMQHGGPDMQQRQASMETLTEPIKIWMKRIELN